ncbi:MAG TPA: PDZ domain-containing protein [Gemmatimonadales bacterium]
MKIRRLMLLTLCALGLAAPVAAQERDAERAAALDRLEEARDELDHALRQLRESDVPEARRNLERAMERLREAERAFRGVDRVSVFRYRSGPGRFEILEPEDLPGVVMFDSDRPRIGVIVETREGEEARDGAVLAAVTPGGPAAEAGLKAGDVIVAVNGTSVLGRDGGSRFVDLVRNAEEGDTLRLEYRREGGRRVALVAPRKLDDVSTSAYAFGEFARGLEGIGERLEGRLLSRADSGRRWELVEPGVVESLRGFGGEGDMATAIVSRLRGGAFLDLQLVIVNPDLASYFGTDKGVLVVKASTNEDIPLKGGDVIISIDGREPRNPAHAMRILQSYERGDKITLEIMRDKRRQTIAVAMPDGDR